MIKIIEEPKKEFVVRCPHCGCKFSYELEDVKTDYYCKERVQCPSCKTACEHKIKEDITGILDKTPGIKLL